MPPHATIRQRTNCRGAIFCARPSMPSPAPASPYTAVRPDTGAVFFRRSRLFLREAAFFSGGEGCEWGAKQPTVGESGDKAENEFSGFIPLAVPRKGFSPHIPASRLFVLFHPTQPTIPPSHPSHHPSKPHQIKQPLSKIAVNERAVVNLQSLFSNHLISIFSIFSNSWACEGNWLTLWFVNYSF